jgi:hypothetical protein
MTELERKRDQMIAHLEQALALADGLNDSLTGYLIERALDEARAGSIGGDACPAGNSLHSAPFSKAGSGEFRL